MRAGPSWPANRCHNTDASQPRNPRDCWWHNGTHLHGDALTLRIQYKNALDGVQRALRFDERDGDVAR